MSEILIKLGKAIRRRRKALGLSQEELGKAAGLGRTVVSSFERGSFSELGVRKVDRLAHALGLELCLRDASPWPTLDDLQMDAEEDTP